jgi:hypothetical protein
MVFSSVGNVNETWRRLKLSLYFLLSPRNNSSKVAIPPLQHHIHRFPLPHPLRIIIIIIIIIQ